MTAPVMGMASHWWSYNMLPGTIPGSVQAVLDKAWAVLRMRFGLASTLGATAVAALGGLVQAQCPDYTTFSQVRAFW